MGKRAERPATSNDDRHDTLKQLRIFCETARQGTMTAAAQSLGMSQPAVSAQMRRLEQRFDLTLFTRKGPSVVPSPAGQRLYRVAAPLVEDADRLAERFMEEHHGVAIRELRIGAGQTCADHVLPPYLEELVARHPKTEIRVTTGTGRETLKRLRDGELCIAAGALDITPDDLTFHPMHESEVVVITPKDHPLANRASVTAEEIAGEQFVAHTAHQEARKVLDAILRWRHDIKADVRAEIDTWNAITGWVAAGAGIAIVPEISVRDDARVGKARLEGGMPTRIYGAITRRNVRLSLSARRFLEVVHERTGAPAGTHRG